VRDPEIEQLDARDVAAHEKEVARLDVAMDRAARVDGGENFGRLPRERDVLGDAEGAARDAALQVLALEPFHGEVRLARGRHAVRQVADDARMLELGDQGCLAAEAPGQPRVGLPEDLECDGFVCLPIARPVIDAVFVTDANLQEAIRRGADELWVIWTVSERGEWQDGLVANYFQVIEATANGQFKQILARIDANNRALAAGQAGEFGRRIDLHILKAEVPVHYLINLDADRFAEAVELGIEAGRRFCRENHIPLNEQRPPPLRVERGLRRARIGFAEELHGYVTLGERDCRSGYREGRRRGTALDYHLEMQIDDVDRFIVHPAHEVACTGYVQCEALGGRLSVEQGVVSLLVADETDPSMKRMFYRLHLRDGAHRALTLFGYKEVVDDPGFDAWSDTTTLFVSIAEGHLAEPPKEDAIIGAGILRLGVRDLFRMLSTFRADAPMAGVRAATMARFGRAFLGKLWDVYARG
jgi:hypothetical protein